MWIGVTGAHLYYSATQRALIHEAEEGDHYWQTGHSDGTKDFVLTLRSKSLFEEQDDNPKDVLSKSDEGSSVEEHDDVSKNAEDISRKKKSHKTGICMDGQEVFKFAVRKVPELTEELLEKSGLKIADIDFFILHQANERIVKAGGKEIKSRYEPFSDKYGKLCKYICRIDSDPFG